MSNRLARLDWTCFMYTTPSGWFPTQSMAPILAPEGPLSQPFPRGIQAGGSKARNRRFRGWSAVWISLSLAVACGLDPETRLAEIRSLQEAGEHAATLVPLRELLERAP